MNKRTDIFYNKFSIIYPLVDLFLKPQKAKLFKEINSYPSGKVLEVGVGHGNHLKFYKNHKVTGIDISLKMLEIAKQKNSPHIELLQMNGESLSFNAHSFDYIILSHIISVVDNPEKLLDETYRVLKPDGKIFILNHFTPNNWLKYVDRSFNSMSKYFHFKSVFRINYLKTIKKFTLLKEISYNPFSYFKLLIYKKA